MNFEIYPFEKLNDLLKDITPNKEYEPLSLTIGEPQFKTPQFILDELKRNVRLLNRYPKTAGEQVLRDSILRYLKNRFNLRLKDREIIPTLGTREVLFNFPQFLLHNIDNPVMAFPNPFYQIYEGASKASKAKVIYLDITKKDGQRPTKEILKECDLVIINTPNNPTASVMLMEELKEWVRLALECDFVLLNDECYIDLYLDKPIPSLLNASLEVGNDNFKNILVANSISKRSSAPSLRAGFIAGDSEILRRYMVYRTYVGCASPMPIQYASAVAWSDQKHVEKFRKKYIANFKVAEEILNIKPPLATFYIWLKVDNGVEFTKNLYEKYNLKVMVGAFLGREGRGKNHVRLALVYDENKTRDALSRIKKFLSE